MKISTQTIKFLQNFASINQGIVINPGQKLRTTDADMALFAEAEIPEQFERSFGVYDLKKLLALLSLSKEPDVNVTDTTVQVKGGKSKVSMRHTNIKLIKTPPNDKNVVAEYFITFDMTQENFKWLFDSSSILGTSHIVFRGNDGKITVEAVDVDGKIVDEGVLELGETSEKFKAVLPVERLKILAGDYEVSISSKGVVQLANKNLKLRYWCALLNEPSEFN